MEEGTPGITRPIEVIIAAGPVRPRNGRNVTRSITTPSPPQNPMVTTKATSSTPTSGNPVKITS